MLWLPIQKWERGEFGIHGYLVAAPTWWDHFWPIGSGPCLTYHRRRWLEKQGGYPKGTWRGGNVTETGGVGGGVQVLTFESHLTSFYHVSGKWKKKKKKPGERG